MDQLRFPYQNSDAVVRDQGLWDTQTLSTVTTGQAALFFPDGITSRNFADTNLQTEGALPGDQSILVKGIRFYYAEAATSGYANAAARARALTMHGILRVKVQDLVAVDVRCADAGVPALHSEIGGDAAVFQVGAGHCLGYRLDPKNQFVINPNQSLRVELELGTSNTVAMTAQTVVVNLIGETMFPAGRA